MSFGEPLMAGTMPATAGSRFEDMTERWWAKWRQLHVNARAYDKYRSTTVVGRFFMKHLMTVVLMVVAFFALAFYAVGMTVCYLSDDVVTPRLQLRKERRMRAAAVKYETRRMVHSDLE